MNILDILKNTIFTKKQLFKLHEKYNIILMTKEYNCYIYRTYHKDTSRLENYTAYTNIWLDKLDDNLLYNKNNISYYKNITLVAIFKENMSQSLYKSKHTIKELENKNNVQIIARINKKDHKLHFV